jgi:hypothetical protein
MTNTVEIKSEETGADAPIAEETKTTGPEIEIVDQGGTKVARPKQEDTEDRPEALPEKFKSVEDLAKAYTELEKKLGQPKQTEEIKEEDNKQSDSKEPEEVEKTDEKSEDQTEATKTHDLSKFSEEWAEKGELSENSYKELKKLGYPQEFVDTYIEGFQAIQDRQVGEVYKTVGGEENYKAMTEWASANLPENEVASYDNIITGSDPSQTKLAVKGLWAQYTEANGKQPKLIGGSQSGVGSVTPFRSTAEVVKAMSDPRYSNDSAYRKDVEKRLEFSDVL